jgi:glycosyltransferase involved in cell wall biosynthesis
MLAARSKGVLCRMKILIISYWFLPSSVPNAKRPFYFAEAFLKEGWSVDVLTSYAGMTPNQKELISHPNLNIQRINDPVDSLFRKSNAPVKTLVWRLLRAVLWPDHFVIWAFRALFEIRFKEYDRAILCLRPESLLLSFFMRVSHRWIIDCQEVFYPVYVGNRRSPIPWILSPVLIWLQRHAFSKAGSVFFTSELARKEYIRRKLVDADRTVHGPLFFDDKAYKSIPPPQAQFVIAYFGLFGSRDGVRNPEPFFRAVKLFLSRNPEARFRTMFIFYGSCENESEVIKCITRLGLQDVVDMNPPVPYERYLELLTTASVFLLLVASQDKFFIPSKMLDYFGAQRPILGFVPFDSEAYSMLKDANMDEYVCGEQDVERGSENIEKLWNKWENGAPLCENSKTTMWSASFQTARVLQIMKSEKGDPFHTVP